MNLVADAVGRIFLFGFETTPAGEDHVDLFSLDLTHDSAMQLHKVSRKPMRLSGNNRFQSAGGIWIDQGRLAILSSEHDLKAEIRINVARE